MTADKLNGWLSFGAGAAALFMQIWAAVHGMMPDITHTAVGTALTTHGLVTLNKEH